MTPSTPILSVAALLVAAAAAAAQEPRAPVAAGAETDTSEFRTFEPTREEWDTFRGAGTIPHQGGQAVYAAVCAGCHMPDGQGAVGAGAYPALANNERLAAPSYPITLVLHGQGAMPPFGGLLDDAQVADVVNYVRGHFGNDFAGGELGDATPEDVAGTRE